MGWEDDIRKAANDRHNGILKGFSDFSYDDIEKAKKDLSKLTQKTITDKLGHSRKVWVKIGEDGKEIKSGKNQESDDDDSDVQEIIDGAGSKSDKAKKLAEMGMSIGEIAKKLGMHYSQAHQVVKKQQEGGKSPKGEKESGGEKVMAQEAISSELQKIVDSNMPQTQKVNALLEMGLTDKKFIAEATGAHYSRVHQLFKLHQEGGGGKKSPKISQEQQHAARVEAESDGTSEKFPKVSTEEKWESYEMFVDMVASGMAKSCIAFGTGGVGKTFTMSKVLKKYGMTEFHADHNTVGDDNYDYVKITGKATPTAMYKAMFEHNGKLIVFDDCDSVLQDETSINLFKGALDTSGIGTLAYESGKAIKTDSPNGIETAKGGMICPSRFDFSGRVIFISNLAAVDMPQPLVDSRALAVDLTMNIEQTIERLDQIKDKIPIEDINGKPLAGVTPEDRDEVVRLIEKTAPRIRMGKLNARTFINIMKIKVASKKSGMDWERAALAMLTS